MLRQNSDPLGTTFKAIKSAQLTGQMARSLSGAKSRYSTRQRGRLRSQQDVPLLVGGPPGFIDSMKRGGRRVSGNSPQCRARARL